MHSSERQELDAALVQEFQKGSAEAFGELYDRYIKPIFAFVYYRTNHRETAEDLTSHVFTKALEYLPSFDTTRGTFQAWLYRIARTTVIDHYRTRRTHDDIDAHADVGAADHAAEHLDTKLESEKVFQAINQLPEEQREVVLLRVYSELSHAEIAAVLGKSEAASKMTFSRAVALLKQSLVAIMALTWIVSSIIYG